MNIHLKGVSGVDYRRIDSRRGRWHLLHFMAHI